MRKALFRQRDAGSHDSISISGPKSNSPSALCTERGDKFAYQIGNCEFTAHREPLDGPNTGPAYANHSVVTKLKIRKPGELHATSLCNIHGLWENSKPIKVE